MKTELQKKNINWIFGLIFLLFGIGLIYHSITDFFTYNFTTVLFFIMRSNSSIIAEFIFGILLVISGVLIFLNNSNWLHLIKILTIGIIINIVFTLILRIVEYEFDLDLLIRVFLGIIFSLGTYKLTEYMLRINNEKWNLKGQTKIFIIGALIGLFPFLFRSIFF